MIFMYLNKFIAQNENITLTLARTHHASLPLNTAKNYTNKLNKKQVLH